jgi:hypothetical protein
MPFTTTDIVCYNLALPIVILICAGTWKHGVAASRGSFVEGTEREVWESLHTLGFVKHTFRSMYLLGMVESTQGIILLGKMWHHVTFGNVYWEIDCLHT